MEVPDGWLQVIRGKRQKPTECPPGAIACSNRGEIQRIPRSAEDTEREAGFAIRVGKGQPTSAGASIGETNSAAEEHVARSETCGKPNTTKKSMCKMSPTEKFFLRVKNVQVQCINKTRTSLGYSRPPRRFNEANARAAAQDKITPHLTFQAHSTLRRRMGGSGLVFSSANRDVSPDQQPPTSPASTTSRGLAPRPTSWVSASFEGGTDQRHSLLHGTPWPRPSPPRSHVSQADPPGPGTRKTQRDKKKKKKQTVLRQNKNAFGTKKHKRDSGQNEK